MLILLKGWVIGKILLVFWFFCQSKAILNIKYKLKQIVLLVTLPPCHTSLLIVYCKQSQGWATWENKEHHCKHLCAPLSTLSIIYFFPLLSDLSIAVYRQDNKVLLSMPVTESYVIPDISWQDRHCKWRHWTLMAIYT